jgi:hypothetical protein
MHNDIDGGWDGVSRPSASQVGYDDGMLVLNEDADIVASNTIRNAWDACFETVGNLSNSLVAGNVLTNCDVAGVGAYYSTSWSGNLIVGNNVSRSALFAWLFWAGNPSGSQTLITFANNVFDSNTFSAPTGTRSMIIGFPSSLPLPQNVSNNVLKNNSFGLPVNLVPVQGFIDAGGNRF